MGGWLVLLVGAGLLLVLRQDAEAIGGLDHARIAGLVAAGAVAYFIWATLTGGYRGRIGRAFQDAVAWAAIGFVLLAAYSHRDQFAPVMDRMAGMLVPGTPLIVQSPAGEGRDVRIRRQGDGHFVARAHVNGAQVRMIVDTGASTVVLRQEDARRVGIDVSALSYSVPVRTANGLSYAARVRLDTVAVGPLTLRDVTAMVAQPGSLHQSLLGMSFLSRLRSYEFSGDFLTLRT